MSVQRGGCLPAETQKSERVWSSQADGERKGQKRKVHSHLKNHDSQKKVSKQTPSQHRDKKMVRRMTRTPAEKGAERDGDEEDHFRRLQEGTGQGTFEPEGLTLLWQQVRMTDRL